MKILFISHRFPYPPDSGTKIRAYNMVRHLNATHEVTVASLVRSQQEAEEGAGIASHCSRYEVARVHAPVQLVRMIGSLPTRSTASSAYFHSPDLARRIRRLLASEAFDLIVVHSSSVAQYVANVQGIPKILDFCDMDSQKWLAYVRYRAFPLNLGYWLEGAKLVAEEKRLARAFDLCTTATRAEAATLDAYSTGVPTDWFPIGVDSDHFSPRYETTDSDVVSFVGRMDYFPNEQCVIEFCRDTFPRIRERRPEAKFLIVGADPTPAICRLGDMRGVTVTGRVPDVRPYLRQSAVMVAPLTIARGTQNKILEAMATGVPVVTSRIAARGVDAVPGTHFIVADSPSEVAEATLALMGDAERRRSLGAAGRGRVMSHHAWDMSMRRLDGIIERCVASHAPAGAIAV